jgi:hypothetical protein
MNDQRKNFHILFFNDFVVGSFLHFRYSISFKALDKGAI